MRHPVTGSFTEQSLIPEKNSIGTLAHAAMKFSRPVQLVLQLTEAATEFSVACLACVLSKLQRDHG
jgi:hypothetical protein